MVGALAGSAGALLGTVLIILGLVCLPHSAAPSPNPPVTAFVVLASDLRRKFGG